MATYTFVFVYLVLHVAIGFIQSHSAQGPEGRCIVNGSLDVPELINKPKGKLPAFAYQTSKYFIENIIGPSGFVSILEENDGSVNILAVVAHFKNYLIPLVIGLLVAILMPLCGCLVCVCRTCCCCCCKSTKKKPVSKCKRHCCNSCLFVFLVVMSTGVPFVFIASQMIYDQTKQTGLTQTFSEVLQTVDGYRTQTTNDLWDVKNSYIDGALGDSTTKIQSLPADVHKDIGISTESWPLFEQAKVYVYGLPVILHEFRIMKRETRYLSRNSGVLNNRLRLLNKRVNDGLGNCTKHYCRTVVDDVGDLKMDADFSKVKSVVPVIRKITYLLYSANPNIPTEITIGEQSNKTMGKLIANSTQKTLSEVSAQITQLSVAVEGALNNTVVFVETLNTGRLQNFTTQNIGPKLSSIGVYIYIVCLTLCSVPLLIAFLYLLGLLFGVCGEQPGPETGFCSKGIGACCLLTGVCFTFLFVWILMLVTTVLFLVGSVATNEVCPLLVVKNNTELTYLSNLAQMSLNISFDIRETVENCEANQALYTAFQIEKNFPDLNLSKILDLSKYGLDDLFDELRNVNFTLPSIKFMTDGLENDLNKLDAVYKKVNFDDYETELRKPLVSNDLLELSTLIREKGNATSDKRVKMTMEGAADDLNDIYTSIIVPMTTEEVRLNESFGKVLTFVGSLNITTFIPKMKRAQKSIDNERISDSLSKNGDEIFDIIQTLATSVESSIRCDIGQCQAVYVALSSTVAAVCDYALDPINVFWVFHGWCIFLGAIPLLFVALCLVTEFRKSIVVAPLAIPLKVVSGKRKGKFTEKPCDLSQ